MTEEEAYRAAVGKGAFAGMNPPKLEPQKLKVLDLFSGIGGFSLGLERTGGFETVAFCEIDPFCRRVLAKHWPNVRQYEDVRSLTAGQLAADGIERVDAICGGFPCQDISYAGPGSGLAGERSGLFFEYARLIGELAPKVVLVENVAALLDRGMDLVLGTLSDLGFDAEWDTVSACAVGYPHMRRRVFLVAYAHGFDGRERLRHTLARTFRSLQAGDGFESARSRQRARLADPSGLYGGADGLPDGMDRNHAIGNAIVPDIPEMIGRAVLESTEHVREFRARRGEVIDETMRIARSKMTGEPLNKRHQSNKQKLLRAVKRAEKRK